MTSLCIKDQESRSLSDLERWTDYWPSFANFIAKNFNNQKIESNQVNCRRIKKYWSLIKARRMEIKFLLKCFHLYGHRNNAQNMECFGTRPKSCKYLDDQKNWLSINYSMTNVYSWKELKRKILIVFIKKNGFT